MKRRVPVIAIALSGFFAVGVANSQELTAEQKAEFVRQAQPRYYSPVDHGFVSMTCDLKLDWDTVPKTVLPPPDLAGRDQLENTKLRFTMKASGGPAVSHEYTSATPAAAKPVFDTFFAWATNLVNGVFATWAIKAMQTPIPDVVHITSLSTDQNSYLLKLVNGVPIELTLSKDYVITRILTKPPAQTLDEHTVYSPSPQGLLLTDIDTTITTSDGTTHVIYDLSYQTVDTLEFPQSVHLKVDDNIDMKFSLQGCSAERGTVIQVAPPPQ